MTASILRASRLAAACVFALTVSIFVPTVAWAYDVELDAGIRAGSAAPSALGALSWSATKIAGAYAVGTTGDGEASIDAEGNLGVDAELRGDASYSTGTLVAGLRLAAAAFRSVETGEDSLDLSFSTPVTLNGSALSLSFVPVCGAGFYDEESVYFGATLSLSYLAGSFVLKPGAELAQTVYPDGARTLLVAPAIGVVWYPGLPLSADFSVGWSRSETDSGELTTRYPVSVALSAVPLPWLCLTAKFESEADVSGFMSYRAEGEVELIRYVPRGSALHLPVSAYYAWDDGETARYGASVMIGWSFGTD